MNVENVSLLIITGAGWLGFLTYANNMLKMVNGKQDQKVDRHECHTAQEAFRQRFDDFEKHMDTRFKDLKEFFGGNDGQDSDTDK